MKPIFRIEARCWQSGDERERQSAEYQQHWMGNVQTLGHHVERGGDAEQHEDERQRGHLKRARAVRPKSKRLVRVHTETDQSSVRRTTSSHPTS